VLLVILSEYTHIRITRDSQRDHGNLLAMNDSCSSLKLDPPRRIAS
jgi:hypothetical protein